MKARLSDESAGGIPEVLTFPPRFDIGGVLVKINVRSEAYAAKQVKRLVCSKGISDEVQP